LLRLKLQAELEQSRRGPKPGHALRLSKGLRRRKP
jgi:hypothetical protein